ncbi:hypothetical protein [Streptomyces sp. NRRL S-350]|uniref:hypothetical protein n=1 Tax=Streptomyces sp. NRRL S-350 TaxID=1463902 RepID=UPI0004BFD92D|nr:hypothetical protein [Streptomyces sp. NRRL S-350]
MTATGAEPDGPATDAPDPWQRIEDGLTQVGECLRTETGAAITAMDACLARLDALRRTLAHHPRPPH